MPKQRSGGELVQGYARHADSADVGPRAHARLRHCRRDRASERGCPPGRGGVPIPGAGSVAGVALAVAFGRIMSGMLYGVSVTDPTTLGSVVLMVLTISVLAWLLPAIRAA